MRQKDYWTHNISDVYIRGDDPEKWAKKGAVRKRQHYLTLFLPTGPPESVVVDTPGPHSRTENVNQFVVIITDRYSKFTRTRPAAKTSTLYVARLIVDN